MITLRPYQRESVDAIYAYWQSGGGNPLIVLPTAAGKSLVIATLVQELCEAYSTLRIAIVTHIKELIAQNFSELLKLWPQAPAGIYSAGIGRRDARARVLFCGIQSVWNKIDRIGHVDVLLVDECFRSGTLVDTANGPARIETIRPGDLVRNALGYGVVRATSKRRSNDIVSVRLSNGTTIDCTGNHPFFTSKGWIKARDLGRGVRLFSVEDVRELRRGVSSLDERRGTTDAQAPMGKAEILLDLLLKEKRECDVGAWSEGEDDQYVTSDRASSAAAPREWTRYDEAASECVEMARRRVGGRAFDSDTLAFERWVPARLQSGYLQPDDDDCNRIGRGVSQGEAFRTRQEKGRASPAIWVESISHQEQGCGCDVFNIDVSGHPSYYAGGVLVHNCHLIPKSADTTYGKFIARLREETPDMRVVGLTATPYRLDSGRLDRGDDRIFDAIAYEAKVSDLIDQGFLSPLVSKATATALDVTGVGKRGGDFIPGQLEAAVNQDQITRAAVSEIVRFGEARRAWLAFCCGVDHALAVRDEIRTHGIVCETVTGETPAGERDRIIGAFRSGQIKCLTSVGVLTTGFNVPHVDLVALLRPTQSAGLYVQSVGRAFRLAPGKADALILDFAGNVKRHGPVDAVHVKGERSGKGDGETEVRAKECPACQTIVALPTRTCPSCGHEWIADPEPKHEATADAETAIISRGAPAWIDVDDVRYYRHEKPGSPPSLRVEYVCGFVVHREWVCFSHQGYARSKAESWWRRASETPIPRNTEDALKRVDEIAFPSAIQIRPDGKFFQIVGRRFDRSVAA